MSIIRDRLFFAASFAISALLTIRLFVGLAEDPLTWALMAGLALLLECGKVRVTNLYRQKRKKFLAALAGLIVVLSLVASAGSALLLIDARRATAEAGRAHATQVETKYALEVDNIRVLDTQIASLAHKLDETPGQWAGTVKSLSSELARLQGIRSHAYDELAGTRDEGTPLPGQADMLGLFAEAMGADEGALLFVFLVVVSGALESLILVSSGEAFLMKKDGEESQKRKNFSRRGRPPKPLDVDSLLPEFSRRMLGSINPRGFATASRDSVAKAMGISGWDGKKLYSLAVERGYLETRGHRTAPGRRKDVCSVPKRGARIA